MSSLILLLLISSWSLAMCEDLAKLADFLDTKKFVRASDEYKSKNNGKEMSVNVSDINQAKSAVFLFPAFKDLGFGLPGKNWEPMPGRLEKSKLFGKRVGWRISNEHGYASVRLDWDPVKGAHYNIHIDEKRNGKRVTHKLAVGFLCNNRPCEENEVVKMADKMQ